MRRAASPGSSSRRHAAFLRDGFDPQGASHSGSPLAVRQRIETEIEAGIPDGHLWRSYRRSTPSEVCSRVEEFAALARKGWARSGWEQVQREGDRGPSPPRSPDPAQPKIAEQDATTVSLRLLRMDDTLYAEDVVAKAGEFLPLPALLTGQIDTSTLPRRHICRQHAIIQYGLP